MPYYNIESRSGKGSKSPFSRMSRMRSRKNIEPKAQEGQDVPKAKITNLLPVIDLNDFGFDMEEFLNEKSKIISLYFQPSLKNELGHESSLEEAIEAYDLRKREFMNFLYSAANLGAGKTVYCEHCHRNHEPWKKSYYEEVMEKREQEKQKRFQEICDDLKKQVNVEVKTERVQTTDFNQAIIDELK